MACQNMEVEDNYFRMLNEATKYVNLVDSLDMDIFNRDPVAASASIRAELASQLDMLNKLDHEALLKRRYERLMSYGL